MEITNAIDKNAQDKISPEQALTLLKEGNQRFINKQGFSIDYKSQIEQTAGGQFPHSIILSCIDSRIPTETIFDQGIGDVFNARIAGNFVNEDILGSMEFATKLSGVKLILVLGHTACGAVKGACDNAELGNLTGLLDKIKPAINAIETPEGTDRSSNNIGFVNDVAVKNVELSIQDTLNQSPVIKELVDAGEVKIAGAMYDISNGKVSFL